MEGTRKRILIVLAIIAALGVIRLLPHPPNFTPLGAIAIFAGVHLGRKMWAYLIPALILLLTDLVAGPVFYEGFLWVYLAYIPLVLIGRGISTNRNPISIGFGALSGAIIFFLISNFGVWVHSALYPKTLEGLGACYAMGLPFLRNDILGTIAFCAVAFAVYDFIRNRVPEIELD